MAIYNPTYNPYQPYNGFNIPTQPQQNSGIIWVQGEAGAKAFGIAPGATVILMDSETDRFYIKSSDASGIPQPLRVFTYKEETGAQQAPSNPTEYVTREEFERKIAELSRRNNDYKKGDNKHE